jgi:hypothetical protein
VPASPSFEQRGRSRGGHRAAALPPLAAPLLGLLVLGLLGLAACGDAGPYTATVYTVTPADPAHVALSVAVFNGGNSPGSPTCKVTATSAAGTGSSSFGFRRPIGVARSVVVRDTVRVPGAAAASVGYRDVAVSCS